MKRVLMPLPDHDFDPSESALPWRMLRDAGHAVDFATEHGAVAACDPLLLTGVVFGRLGALAPARDAYRCMQADDAYRAPRRWADVDVARYDALLLPGGHAQGMRPYLDSTLLQQQVARFAALDRPLAAICHGVLLPARARAGDGRSVLHARRTTCLPKYMEALAYGLSAWKHGRYYRTYPAYVEDEVRAALATPAQFVRGPLTLGWHGSEGDDRHAFVVEDGNYVSARWPGDAWHFARVLLRKLG